jgi:hypothetical protein
LDGGSRGRVVATGEGNGGGGGDSKQGSKGKGRVSKMDLVLACLFPCPFFPDNAPTVRHVGMDNNKHIQDTVVIITTAIIIIRALFHAIQTENRDNRENKGGRMKRASV